MGLCQVANAYIMAFQKCLNQKINQASQPQATMQSTPHAEMVEPIFELFLGSKSSRFQSFFWPARGLKFSRFESLFGRPGR